MRWKDVLEHGVFAEKKLCYQKTVRMFAELTKPYTGFVLSALPAPEGGGVVTPTHQSQSFSLVLCGTTALHLILCNALLGAGYIQMTGSATLAQGFYTGLSEYQDSQIILGKTTHFPT